MKTLVTACCVLLAVHLTPGNAEDIDVDRIRAYLQQRQLRPQTKPGPRDPIPYQDQDYPPVEQDSVYVPEDDQYVDQQDSIPPGRLSGATGVRSVDDDAPNQYAENQMEDVPYQAPEVLPADEEQQFQQRAWMENYEDRQVDGLDEMEQRAWMDESAVEAQRQYVPEQADDVIEADESVDGGEEDEAELQEEVGNVDDLANPEQRELEEDEKKKAKGSGKRNRTELFKKKVTSAARYVRSTKGRWKVVAVVVTTADGQRHAIQKVQRAYWDGRRSVVIYNADKMTKAWQLKATKSVSQSTVKDYVDACKAGVNQWESALLMMELP